MLRALIKDTDYCNVMCDYYIILNDKCGPGSVVGIATAYGLECFQVVRRF